MLHGAYWSRRSTISVDECGECEQSRNNAEAPNAARAASPVPGRVCAEYRGLLFTVRPAAGSLHPAFDLQQGESELENQREHGPDNSGVLLLFAA